MPISDCVTPYKFDCPDAFSPGDEGVPTEKFWAEFPDGQVPIRHVPAMAYEWPTRDLEAWASALLGQYEAVHSYVRSVDACGEARERYLNCWAYTDGPTLSVTYAYRNPRLKERRQALGTMMAEGLTLRQIAAYLPATLDEVLTTLDHGIRLCAQEATALLQADEILAAAQHADQEVPKYAQIARQVGLTEERVASLATLRGLTATRIKGLVSPERESCLDEVLQVRFGDEQTLHDTHMIMRERHPDKPWITYSWVIWHTKRSRPEVLDRWRALQQKESA